MFPRFSSWSFTRPDCSPFEYPNLTAYASAWNSFFLESMFISTPSKWSTGAHICTCGHDGVATTGEGSAGRLMKTVRFLQGWSEDSTKITYFVITPHTAVMPHRISQKNTTNKSPISFGSYHFGRMHRLCIYSNRQLGRFRSIVRY